jgi:hypothetical protein
MGEFKHRCTSVRAAAANIPPKTNVCRQVQTSYRTGCLVTVFDVRLFAVLIYWAIIGRLLFLLGVIGQLLFIYFTGRQFTTFFPLVVYA